MDGGSLERISSCSRQQLIRQVSPLLLIEGINDGDEDAKRLVRLLADVRAKINLIPLNPFPGLDMSPPSTEKIQHFQDILIENHFTAIIRKSKGQDISAACGQLSGEESFECSEKMC